VPTLDAQHLECEPPLLSIVIPVLEPDDELSRCMACILGAMQGMSMPEIIIVTPQQFSAKIAALYPYSRVLVESRRGIYSAMNDGAQAGLGKYIYFLGKDDIILPTLREALLALEYNHPFVLFCDVYWGTHGIYSGKPSPFRILRSNICHQGIIYSRKAFEKYGPYIRKMRVQADHLINIKILWGGGTDGSLHYLDKPLAWYSGDGFSATHRDQVFWRLYPLILHKYVGAWANYFLIMYRTLRRVIH
jgi:glycosyltransferase involved in cell wall biosynthesis